MSDVSEKIINYSEVIKTLCILYLSYISYLKCSVYPSVIHIYNTSIIREFPFLIAHLASWVSQNKSWKRSQCQVKLVNSTLNMSIGLFCTIVTFFSLTYSLWPSVDISKSENIFSIKIVLTEWITRDFHERRYLQIGKTFKTMEYKIKSAGWLFN